MQSYEITIVLIHSKIQLSATCCSYSFSGKMDVVLFYRKHTNKMRAYRSHPQECRLVNTTKLLRIQGKYPIMIDTMFHLF
ncbi:hypothetical protein D3C71_840790 [compost metagenome]